MVQYKLTYGDVRGLGEPARQMFHYAGVKFEDDRLPDFTVVETMRDQLPYGQVPLLTIDGKVKIAQSQAIFRLLARRFSLGGKDDVDQAVVDSYGDFLVDLINNLRPYVAVLGGRAEGDKAKLAKEAQEYVDTKWEKYFNKIFEASGSGFLHKSGLTWPDFVVANFYETANNLGAEPITKMKNFKKIHDNVKALPQLSKYLAQRKQTQF